MTAQKHLKKLVRGRMQKTGESYSSARRQVTQEASPSGSGSSALKAPAGRVPAATVLRTLLAHAGIQAPHTGEPYSEEMLFGIAGGIGMGVCSFHYAKENFSSFFIAGRHSWYDDLAYLTNACSRFGIATEVKESGGAKAADKILRDMLSGGRPCCVWVDMAHLPHRALPASFSGGGYHVITVFSIDDEQQIAWIGDLRDKPIAVPLTALSEARGRIKKQKNRVLALKKANQLSPLPELIRSGLQACHDVLGESPKKKVMSVFRLDAVRQWGERLHGTEEKDSWARIFPPGPHLYQGLKSIYEYIEHYGTGGGLCRPPFADYLAEASAAVGDADLHDLSLRYAELGKHWTSLAEAALPSDVPLFRETKETVARRSKLVRSGASPEEIRACWQHLDDLTRSAKERFPLSQEASADLCAALKKRVLALYQAEVEAQRAIAAWLE